VSSWLRLSPSYRFALPQALGLTVELAVSQIEDESRFRVGELRVEATFSVAWQGRSVSVQHLLQWCERYGGCSKQALGVR